ncbi:sensor histidine kinase [Terrabacter sp. 2RAF25]|uniref:sensor histidine kinase n=1 Tax=Terrabacter sp. 2RAF25 TaxID=3232998 RepID=UPI003F94CCED
MEVDDYATMVTSAVVRAPEPPAPQPGWRPPISDVALVVLVTTLSLVSFLDQSSLTFETDDADLHYAGPDTTGAVEIVLGTSALAWRRRAPGVVLAVSVLSSFVRYWQRYPVPALPFAVIIAVYTTAQLWPLARSAWSLLAVCALMAFGVLVFLSPGEYEEALTEVTTLVCAWSLGRGVRLQKVRTRLLEQHARLLEDRTEQLARERATLAALSSARERATIARELHDIVSGDVGVIVLRAGAARRSLRSDEPAVRDALTSIEALGKGALADMRRLVGVLHADPGDALPIRSPRLDQLESLVDSVAQTGTVVRLEVTGERRTLPPATELNAYRIVQEGLSNALKHAAGSSVEVRVDYGTDAPDVLHVIVRDHGGGRSQAGSSGRGLEGMRQRVASVGGTIELGLADDGGFVVDARLPVGGGGPT